MKLSTKLIISFFVIVFVPILLAALAFFVIRMIQLNTIPQNGSDIGLLHHLDFGCNRAVDYGMDLSWNRHPDPQAGRSGAEYQRRQSGLYNPGGQQGRGRQAVPKF